MLLLVTSACLCLASAASEPVDLNQVVFVINSQPNAHHARVAGETRELLAASLRSEGGAGAEIVLTHEEDAVPFHGAWTYYPALAALAANEKLREREWFVFLEENARVDAALLKSALAAHRPREDALFLGRGVVDAQNVVIHHYDSPGLRYPLAPAGFAVSRALLVELEGRMAEVKKDGRRFPADFNIDPAYELAKTLNRMREGGDEGDEEPGVELVHEPRFCSEAGEGCVAWPASPVCNATDAEVEDLSRRTLFAVKTCKQYHADRLPVVQETWARAAEHVMYFSEEEDAAWGTTVLPGVHNTERGHCGKTLAIIRHFHEELAAKRGFDWLVITDDDTVLGTRRMLEHLKCYSPDDLVALGQRYGFRVGSGHYGYDYPTGGGGMVFSRAVAARMLERDDACRCRSDDAPDDMHLGACMASLGAPVVHSARFHQARPEDYHPDLLRAQAPVSFHKFWNTDPRQWYRDWFRDDDAKLRQRKQAAAQKQRDEL